MKAIAKLFLTRMNYVVDEPARFSMPSVTRSLTGRVRVLLEGELVEGDPGALMSMSSEVTLCVGESIQKKDEPDYRAVAIDAIALLGKSKSILLRMKLVLDADATPDEGVRIEFIRSLLREWEQA